MPVLPRRGDEEGKYVVQDHHWEPPYLDKSAYTKDLEPIAARMSNLIPPVFDRNLALDFSFADALKTAAEEAWGLTEWIEDSGEGAAFCSGNGEPPDAIGTEHAISGRDTGGAKEDRSFHLLHWILAVFVYDDVQIYFLGGGFHASSNCLCTHHYMPRHILPYNSHSPDQ
jgi:hypothetical protein